MPEIKIEKTRREKDIKLQGCQSRDIPLPVQASLLCISGTMNVDGRGGRCTEGIRIHPRPAISLEKSFFLFLHVVLCNAE